MKPYTISVEINLPRNRVIEMFDSVENLYKWQEGLQSFEHLQGEPGQPGAKSKLVFQHGKQRIELIETITKNNLPDEFNGHYEWAGGHNTLHNQFIELSSNSTRWQSTCAYEFKRFMLKVMGVVMPGMFRKQNLKFMTNFKRLCEEGTDVRSA